MGLQPKLGLRPQRWPGFAAGDRAGALGNGVHPPRLLIGGGEKEHAEARTRRMHKKDLEACGKKRLPRRQQGTGSVRNRECPDFVLIGRNAEQTHAHEEITNFNCLAIEGRSQS